LPEVTIPEGFGEPRTIVEATRLALDALREAVRRGLPVYFESRAPGTVVVESRSGKGAYYVLVLLDPTGSRLPVAMGRLDDHVVIGALRPGSLERLEVRVEQVPYALATQLRVMGNYEADAWNKRLKYFDKLTPCGESRDPPGRLYCSPVNPCEKAVIDEKGVVAWIDECTGVIDDARPWQERLGLR